MLIVTMSTHDNGERSLRVSLFQWGIPTAVSGLRKFIFFAANFKGDEATEIRYSGAATVGFPYGLSLSLPLSFSSYTLMLSHTDGPCLCVSEKEKKISLGTKHKNTVLVFSMDMKPSTVGYVMCVF